MQKIGFSLDGKYSVPMPDVIRLLQGSGFDTVSPLWQRDVCLDDVVNTAVRCGLTLQSLHGPLRGLPGMWSRDPACSATIFQDLLCAADACAAYGIPLLVVHSWNGIDYTFREEELYFGNFDQLVEHAIGKGLQIAFENLEGAEYLDALMERYRGCDGVGLCWDSGHERCYTPSRDFLKKYGDRLLMTHLNDNFGVTHPEGLLQGTDDLHLLIGDGNTDWGHTVDRLKQAKPQDILNFEFKIRPKGDRCTTDLYGKWALEQYFPQAYQSACTVAARYFKQ